MVEAIQQGFASEPESFEINCSQSLLESFECFLQISPISIIKSLLKYSSKIKHKGIYSKIYKPTRK